MDFIQTYHLIALVIQTICLTCGIMAKNKFIIGWAGAFCLFEIFMIFK